MNRPGIFRGLLGASLIVVLFIAAAGSMGPTIRQTTDFSPVPIRYGTLVNENLRIVAQDGSFELEPGEDFETPFSVYWWNGQAPVSGTQNLVNEHQQAAEQGARRVRIEMEGEERDLYGLLVFNQAVQSSSGPARQSYYLQVPEDKLQSALNGNVAVAYELIDWDHTYTVDGSPRSRDKTWLSWILWISRTPL